MPPRVTKIVGDRELTSVTHRVAEVTMLLLGGWEPLTRDVEHRYGMSHSGAYDMLDNMSYVLPLMQDSDGKWKIVRSDPDPHLRI